MRPQLIDLTLLPAMPHGQQHDPYHLQHCFPTRLLRLMDLARIGYNPLWTLPLSSEPQPEKESDYGSNRAWAK
jgi:hypothetical protein